MSYLTVFLDGSDKGNLSCEISQCNWDVEATMSRTVLAVVCPILHLLVAIG